MDQLSELRALRRVADAGSFSAAAAAATFNGSHTVVPGRYRRHGMPAVPADLAWHNCLIHTIVPRPRAWAWAFVLLDGGLQTVAVRGSLRANTGLAMRLAALGGIGITTTASFIVQDDLAQGSLVPVLRGYPMRSRSLCAVYPQHHHVSAKVRAFVEFAAEVHRRPAWS